MMRWRDRQPMIHDKTDNTPFDRHYIFHPAWAARKIEEIKPELHVDISSHLSFCTMISARFPVKFYDYREVNLGLSNLSSEYTDLTRLPFPTGSISSLSCLHVIEHIGLGRYGDQINPEGDLLAMKELQRVLKHGGDLLIAVPIGSPKIVFNAHRIYSFDQIIHYFCEMKLKEFTLIPDSPFDGDLVINPDGNLLQKQQYACGCFWFEKSQR